jgi:prevent-host-death family protein
MNIPVGEFKAKCLQLIDRVHDSHEEVVITKFSKPIAKLVAVEEEKSSIFGFLKNSVIIKSDIVTPTQEAWENHSKTQLLHAISF